MGKITALVFCLLVSGVANACQCAFSHLDTAQARAANNVFVFQLLDARVAQEVNAPSSSGVVGSIKVLANVRGKTNAREVRYSTFYCCGSRLEVGKYYVGFLPSDTASFYGNAGNILPLWNGINRATADKLEAVLRGGKRLEDAFSYGLEEIHQMRPPPSPCPEDGKDSQ